MGWAAGEEKVDREEGMWVTVGEQESEKRVPAVLAMAAAMDWAVEEREAVETTVAVSGESKVVITVEAAMEEREAVLMVEMGMVVVGVAAVMAGAMMAAVRAAETVEEAAWVETEARRDRESEVGCSQCTSLGSALSGRRPHMWCKWGRAPQTSGRRWACHLRRWTSCRRQCTCQVARTGHMPTKSRHRRMSSGNQGFVPCTMPPHPAHARPSIRDWSSSRADSGRGLLSTSSTDADRCTEPRHVLGWERERHSEERVVNQRVALG